MAPKKRDLAEQFPDKLEVVGASGDGIDGMRVWLSNSEVMWALLRFEVGSGATVRTKLVLLHFNGEATPVVKRGKFNALHNDIKGYLKDTPSIEVNNTDEVNVEHIISTASKFFVVDNIAAGASAFNIKEYLNQLAKEKEEAEKRKEEERQRREAEKEAKRQEKLAARRASRQSNRIAHLFPNAAEGLKAVASGGIWNWILLGPDAKEMPLLGGGCGSVDEMRECAERHGDLVTYGLVRLGFGEGRLKRTKYAFVHLIGAKVSPVKRGKFNGVRPKMEDAIKAHATCSVAFSDIQPEEFTLENVIDRVKKVVVVDDQVLENADMAAPAAFSIEAFKAALMEEQAAMAQEPVEESESESEDEEEDDSQDLCPNHDKEAGELVQMVRDLRSCNWALFRPKDPSRKVPVKETKEERQARRKEEKKAAKEAAKAAKAGEAVPAEAAPSAKASGKAAGGKAKAPAKAKAEPEPKAGAAAAPGAKVKAAGAKAKAAEPKAEAKAAAKAAEPKAAAKAAEPKAAAKASEPRAAAEPKASRASEPKAAAKAAEPKAAKASEPKVVAKAAEPKAPAKAAAKAEAKAGEPKAAAKAAAKAPEQRTSLAKAAVGAKAEEPKAKAKAKARTSTGSGTARSSLGAGTGVRAAVPAAKAATPKASPAAGAAARAAAAGAEAEAAAAEPAAAEPPTMGRAVSVPWQPESGDDSEAEEAKEAEEAPAAEAAAAPAAPAPCILVQAPKEPAPSTPSTASSLRSRTISLAAAGRRPLQGDAVEVLVENGIGRYFSGLRVGTKGEVGILKEDDWSDQPFRVCLNDGRERWYRAEWIRCLSTS